MQYALQYQIQIICLCKCKFQLLEFKSNMTAVWLVVWTWAFSFGIAVHVWQKNAYWDAVKWQSHRVVRNLEKKLGKILLTLLPPWSKHRANTVNFITLSSCVAHQTLLLCSINSSEVSSPPLSGQGGWGRQQQAGVTARQWNQGDWCRACLSAAGALLQRYATACYSHLHLVTTLLLRTCTSLQVLSLPARKSHWAILQAQATWTPDALGSDQSITTKATRH